MVRRDVLDNIKKKKTLVRAKNEFQHGRQYCRIFYFLKMYCFLILFTVDVNGSRLKLKTIRSIFIPRKVSNKAKSTLHHHFFVIKLRVLRNFARTGSGSCLKFIH